MVVLETNRLWHCWGIENVTTQSVPITNKKNEQTKRRAAQWELIHLFHHTIFFKNVDECLDCKISFLSTAALSHHALTKTLHIYFCHCQPYILIHLLGAKQAVQVQTLWSNSTIFACIKNYKIVWRDATQSPKSCYENVHVTRQTTSSIKGLALIFCLTKTVTVQDLWTMVHGDANPSPIVHVCGCWVTSPTASLWWHLVRRVPLKSCSWHDPIDGLYKALRAGLCTHFKMPWKKLISI